MNPKRACLVLTVALFGAAEPWPGVRELPAPPTAARPAPAPTLAQRLEADPCVTEGQIAPSFDGRCGRLRPVFIDFDEYSAQNPALDRVGGTMLRYDFHEVTRPLWPVDLETEDELSIAVRLIISEVGADRLLASKNALREAVGILATVDHRLDPAYHDPEQRPDAPDFPGCGPDGTFVTCADPAEYLGLQTWRALDPGRGYTPEMLEPAVDLAVQAWYVWREGLVPDPTDGAVSYVHRCGGEAYGQPTFYCDGERRGRRDTPGANPYTGPILFRSVAWWRAEKGWYALAPAAIVDYETWDEHFDPIEETWTHESWEAEESFDAYADAAELDEAPYFRSPYGPSATL